MYLKEHNRKCKYCTTEFKTSKRFQLFCKDDCNKQWNKQNRDYCFYCGDFSTDRDHLIPHSFDSHMQRRTFQGVELVMACSECNGGLSNRLFSTIEDRIKFLIRYYTKRYKLDKAAVQWDAEELADTGYVLKTWIVANQRAREAASERVLYLTRNLSSER